MYTSPESIEQKIRFHGLAFKRAIMPLLIFIAVIWFVEIIDRVFLGSSLDSFGIIPRRLAGLWGIVFAPFLHGSFAHLVANTIPFLLLGFMVMYRYANRFLAITLVIALVSGFGTWLIAPGNTVHIGLSGLIFGYFAYLVVNAWFERSAAAIALAVIVIILYGGILVGVLPTGNGISWQGHLFGAVGGALAAYAYSRRHYEGTGRLSSSDIER